MAVREWYVARLSTGWVVINCVGSRIKVWNAYYPTGECVTYKVLFKEDLPSTRLFVRLVRSDLVWPE